ncbi:DUF6660 family protein [Niabella terrae]
MRLMNFLMAFYLLLLPGISRAASGDCDQDQTVARTTLANNSPKQADDCSPFCHCSCCFHTAPTAIVISKFNPTPVAHLVIPAQSRITPFYPKGVMRHIWQPPKFN